MLMDFIATIASGAGMAGCVLILNRLTGKRLPRWLLPASIGAAMIVFSIWREYTWYPQVRAQLPEGVVIASAPADKVIYRPWTYVFPLITRFIAVDRTETFRSETNPDMFVASAVVIQRWTATHRVPMAFDCGGMRRADLFEGADLSAGGTLTGADWRQVGQDDALLRAACNGG